MYLRLPITKEYLLDV